jgi:hypothetical protein
MEKADLAKNSSNTLQLVPISKKEDLLKCKPILSQIKEVGKNSVLTHIRVGVEKCAMALGINLTDSQVSTLCQDIIDRYVQDSIEDVIECLKKGRMGFYGFGHNTRASLNMLVISEWMNQHLEGKANLRERELSKYKAKSDPLDDVDYESYKIRAQVEIKQKTKMNSRLIPDSMEEYTKQLKEFIPTFSDEQVKTLLKQAETLAQKNIEDICKSELDKR